MAITVEQLTKAGIPTEFHQGIIDLSKADLNGIISSGQYVPKDKMDLEITRRRAAEDQVAERDAQITQLGKFKGDVEDLQKQVDALTTQNATTAKQLQEEQAKNEKVLALTSRLQADNCVDPIEVASKFDLDGISVDANGVVGGSYETQRDALKAAKAYYFPEATAAGAAPKPGAVTPPGFVLAGSTPPAGSTEGDPEVTAEKYAEDMAKAMLENHKSGDATFERAQAQYFGKPAEPTK